MSRITTSLLGLSAVGLVLAAPAPDSKNGQLYGPLHFNEDGSFHITVMQDTHMGDCKVSPLAVNVTRSLTLVE